MIYSKLTNSNIEISKIGLGTVQFGMDYGFTKAKDQKEVDEILDKSLKLGVNFVDTARDYKSSEEKLGNFIKNHPHSNFVIATKIVGINKIVASDKMKLYKHILESIENSLRMLKIEKVELLQLHQSGEYILNNKYFWEIINQMKGKGLFDLFGVSVYDLEEAKNIVNHYSDYVDFIQVPYNVFDQRFSSLFPLFKEKEIDIIGRSAFLKGIIPVENKKIPDELNKIKFYKDRLFNIAEKVGFSVTELALLFVISSNFIQTAIVGVDSPEEMESNVRALEKLDSFRSIEKEMNELKIEDRSLIDPRCWEQL